MTLVNTEIGEPTALDLLAHVRRAQRISSRAPGDRDFAHVYFVQRGHGGPIKIGASTNVVRRLGELQIAAPEPMRLVGVWLMAGTRSERALHNLHCDDCLGGEWFASTTAVWDTVRAFGWPR